MSIIVPFLRLCRRHAFWKKLGKNFWYVKSTFKEHRFDGSPNLCKHKFAVFHCRGAFIFCSPRKWSKRRLSRAPTVLLIITPSADAYRWHFTSKKTISLTLILSQTAASIAYGNISDATFFFGYASHLLLYFRLYCSLANEVLLEFAIYILLTRISQSINLNLCFFILHFAFCILHLISIARSQTNFS